MGITTGIEWCDSTLNLEMGCDGCELWTKDRRSCYAGQLTERWGGKTGWPVTFDQPKTFPARIEQLEKWSDLTGTERSDKPWLNRLPRMVFLNDMGDTFTESLPLNWLEPLLPRLATLPHVIMILTKRAHRMREFFTAVGVPSNFWLYVSVTQHGQHQRVWDLLRIPGVTVRGLSLEPQIAEFDLDKYELVYKAWRKCSIGTYLDHVIQGGESGHGARLFNLAWADKIREQCKASYCRYFFKQAGAVTMDGSIATGAPGFGGYVNGVVPVRRMLRDSKGGDLAELPERFRVRQMPEVATRSRK